MVTTNIDTICKSVLLRKRVGMAYYLDVLLAATFCLREITLDDGLDVVNNKLLPIDSNGIIIIPDGAADVVEVSVLVGQKKRLLIPDDKIDSLHNYDANLNVVPYSSSQASNTNNLYSWGCNAVNVDTYGSNMGRMFGRQVNYTDTYKVLVGRNEIQLNEGYGATAAVVSFVGDGRSADAATHIDINADATISSCADWQLAENSRSYSDGAKERLRQLYLGQRQILRARKADWSIEKLKRIVNKNTRYLK